MKLNKIMQLFLLGILVFTTSCSDKEYDLIDIVYGEMPEATHTISQLKEVFMGENATPLYNNENTNFNNGTDCSFAVYDIDSENDVIINAVVISSDVEGNIYKKLSLRDLKDGSGIDISIDASGLSAVYPVGQKVSVNLKGLQMGYYGEYPTIGVTYFNSNQNRWEPGRMPYPIAKKCITVYELPQAELAKPEVMTIAEINRLGKAAFGKLVTLKNVEFGNEGSYGSFATISDTDVIPFAVPDVSYPTTRMLRDKSNNTIAISTSAYAKFQATRVPSSGKYHNVTAIVSWYRSNVRYEGDWQLVIRAIGDVVEVTDGSGEDEENDNNGGSSSDVIFSAPFSTDMNGFETINVSGDESWYFSEKYGMCMSAFVDNASKANETWAVSQAIGLSGYENPSMIFEHTINKGDVNNIYSNHTLWISKTHSGTAINESDWEQITIPTYPDGKSWTSAQSGSIVIPDEYLGSENVRIAFKYLSSTVESSSWQIKNLIVYGSKAEN